LTLVDFVINQDSNLLMPIIANNSVEQIADFVATAFNNLYKEVLRSAQQAGDAESGIVLSRLLENAVEEWSRERLDRAAGV
jgi:hypothetical protein